MIGQRDRFTHRAAALTHQSTSSLYKNENTEVPKKDKQLVTSNRELLQILEQGDDSEENSIPDR